MPVTTTVTPTDIAMALGRATPTTTESGQWQMWIDDAVMFIQTRVDNLARTDPLDQVKLDYVVREAVVTQVRRPEDVTNVDISVDDGRISKRYSSGSGRVTILDEWWTLLGLNAANSGAFSIDTVGLASAHLPWCALTFGALYCSCGVDIAGYPIYELG